jgi:hypothetical protein
VTWREVGFAGNHQESKLWQKFRTINDQVFAKRQHEKTAQQKRFLQQETDFTQQLNDLVQVIEGNEALSKSLLEQSKQQAQALLVSIVSKKPVIKAVAIKAEQLIEQIESHLHSLANAEQKQQWSTLFDLLSELGSKKITATCLPANNLFLTLSNFWQKRIREHAELTHVITAQERFDKTIEIEILAQSASPEELREQRMAIQVKLMQEKMASGKQTDLTESLIEWLTLGSLSEEDLTLLPRLESVFCK